ncbi:putative pumilio homolog 8, chloroplastic [Ricinus communis]|uniref:putative pumilio homolog 8, chloroplastic n=1 Tax=Ricinus communis TaxID=3988 RepID=UPI00201ADBFA|nr:putative pumilio homolog 8, chloroplastic [Ricinus communis]
MPLGSFHGYNGMNFQSNSYGGASTSAVEERNESSCTVGQDSIPGMQNQDSFIMFASTQQGSEYLQDLLATSDSYLTTSKILDKVTASVVGIPVINYLMVDQHGYHVCSKLIDSCNDIQLTLILERITKNTEQFVRICCAINGSKMIKKLIKKVKRSCLISYLTVSLYKGFYQLAINQIGSYVVVFCMDCLDIQQNALLYEAAISHCLILATDAIGCVSANKFIDRIQGSRRQTLLELISDNAVFLSQDPSGNHVVQKVLGLEHPIINAKIGAQLKGHYVRLSFQKWGSHVVEKCLVSQAMVYAVQDLLTCGSSQLLQIARDQFGNYVIQKALKVTKKKNIALHRILLNSLEPNLNALRNGFGKKVYSLIMDGIPVNEG